MEFLIQYAGDILVLSVLAAVVGGIVYKLLKDRKQGRTACGCDCSKCSKGCIRK